MLKADFLIIGAGIIGLAIAKVLRDAYPEREIFVIDKENDLGFHASGRNSGVLHAGFYYSPDSLKAKFTRQGNIELRKFCEEKGLRINECGKAVVAKSEEELETLFELKRRGERNGVELYLITEQELKDYEPNARTYKYALWSPNTAVVDPLEVLKALKKELEDKEVRFFFNTPFEKAIKEENTVFAGGRIFQSEKIINCSGLYADKVAKEFGFCKCYEIVPFKGVYIEYTGKEKFIRTNIYPVPDIRFPFLGVHFTLKVDGKIKIGPTAMPAFWRQNYNGFERFNFEEFSKIVATLMLMFLKKQEIRRLALEEFKKYSKAYLLEEAKKLVYSLPDPEHFKWGKPGIRAQLVDKKDLNLVQDFVVEGDDYSVHILNAVSPAFTASFPFARYVLENFINRKEVAVHG
ncbi:L-2-hydroxyglutarate oxidase [Thermocrinis sp.]